MPATQEPSLLFVSVDLKAHSKRVFGKQHCVWSTGRALCIQHPATRGLPSTDSGQTHIDKNGSLGSNNYVQELDCQSGMD